MESPVFESICSFLVGNNAEFTVIEHAAFSNTQEAAEFGAVEMSQGAKSMVFKSLGKYILAVTPADTTIDYKKLKKCLGTNNIRLARPDEVLEVTGCKVGTCHPFGNLLDIRTICDLEIADKNIIAINAGERTRTITLLASDYLALVAPELANIHTE